MFKKWKLRRIGFKLMGLSADFERAHSELTDREDTSAAAYELRKAIETVQDSLSTLEQVAIESDTAETIDHVFDQLDETELWLDEATDLVEEIGEIDRDASADLFEQLADIYERMATISEILAEKLD